MSKTITIQNETHLNDVLSSDKNVVVDFYADWCGPCQSMLKVLDQTSSEMEDVTFCKVNVDEFPSIARQNDVKAIPSLQFFQNGIKIKTTVGSKSKSQFISETQKIFNQ